MIQTKLIFADAPIDQFARGHKNALTANQKKGAALFFGRGRCVECHAVSGPSNEMFSDFRRHVIGVPQIAPLFGNLAFDGPRADEDFGLEQVTGTLVLSTVIVLACGTYRIVNNWKSKKHLR